MDDKRFCVNNFGWIPYNPDVALDLISTGPGSERPISFGFNQIFKLYWTVKSFKYSITVQTNPDLFSQFLLGGGSSFSLVGAMSGLSMVDMLANTGGVNVAGKTSLKQSFNQSLRKVYKTTDEKSSTPEEFFGFTSDRIENNQLISKVRRLSASEILKAKSENFLPTINTKNKEINEGTLISAGPIHSDGKLTIDFSSIVYKRNAYWPKIVFSHKEASSLSSGGAQTIGGVNFLGGLLPIYMNVPVVTFSTMAVSFGAISVGTEIKDRFYFDGKDSERK